MSRKGGLGVTGQEQSGVFYYVLHNVRAGRSFSPITNSPPLSHHFSHVYNGYNVSDMPCHLLWLNLRIDRFFPISLFCDVLSTRSPRGEPVTSRKIKRSGKSQSQNRFSFIDPKLRCFMGPKHSRKKMQPRFKLSPVSLSLTAFYLGQRMERRVFTVQM